MSVQVATCTDDESAAFIGQAAKAGEGRRADVIKREIRRRAGCADLRVLLGSDLEPDTSVEWARRNAGQVSSELD